MYDTRTYEVLFDQVNVVPLAEQLKGIWCQRTRTITSGPIVECVSFPVLTARPKAACDELKKSREAQKNLNEKNAKLTLDRKINSTFGPGDLLISMTFLVGHQPIDDDAALAEAQKYIRRLRS